MLDAPARILDPVTGLDVEDQFGQIDAYRARGLRHPNDDSDTPARMRAGQAVEITDPDVMHRAAVRIAARKAASLLRQRVGIAPTTTAPSFDL